MNDKPLFVTGIGTGVGKTVVSAVLCQQLKTDYWKPVQSGELFNTDGDIVWQLVTNKKTIVLSETFRLHLPASPHESAFKEGIEIVPEDFNDIPKHHNPLLIEGAGGLLVPLSPTYLMIDLIKQLNAEVVLVTRDYLGCINHTLLSLLALDSYGIPLKHVVFNGNFNEFTKEAIISRLPQTTTWSRLPEFEEVNKLTIAAAPVQIHQT